MLTRLHFKNWRSLRDVTIDDMKPITVFVGANSSGKTNIVEALHFLRRMIREDAPAPIYFRAQQQKIRNVNADEQSPIELAISFIDSGLSYSLTMQPEGEKTKFIERLTDSRGETFQTINGIGAIGDMIYGGNADGTPSLVVSLGRFSPAANIHDPIQVTYQFVAHHLQILRENFVPSVSFPADEYTSGYLIDDYGKNTASILEFMQREHPETYSMLHADLSWLLNHVDKLETVRDEQETRISVHEKVLGGKEAPTISAGTSRLIAMLTAYHALDMRTPQLPGLVVIEEPDTAVHPLLLKRLVELFRNYTDDPDHPRQIILTTHNPMLLNYFEPEEVRIVERNERGETTVSDVPKDIADIWRETDGAYNLGNLWTTRLLGGVPE
jgi:predicted ATPase